MLLELPQCATLDRNVSRHVDLSPATKAMGEGFPVMSAISLNWRVASGAAGTYCVMATHPSMLDETVAAVENAPAVEPELGLWAQGGSMQGVRLGHHLRNLADRAGVLAAPGPDAEAFEATLGALSELVSGFDRCRWRVSRRDERHLMTEVECILSPAVSAGTR
jgi:hypothetical protein